jgi:hypothetical protein
LITLIILGEEYKLRSFSLGNTYHTINYYNFNLRHFYLCERNRRKISIATLCEI